MSLVKVFISGKARDGGLDRVAKLYELFDESGLEINFRWATSEVELDKPYRENLQSSANIQHQQTALDAATSADFFILLGEPDLHGALIEFGAFLGSLRPGQDRIAYIVDDNSEPTVFDTNPAVTIFSSIEEVIKDIRNRQ